MSFDFTDRKIAVIGDVMLDAYIEGSVTRISPEAPVPVVLFRDQRYVPGGAANVTANIAALGAAVRLVGAVGRDPEADSLRTILRGIGNIDLESLVSVRDRSTTVKTRVIGERQQIVRIDREDTSPFSAESSELVIQKGRDAIAWADVVIFSDYGKGLLSTATLRCLIDAAREAGKKTIVDPKRADVTAYAGVDFITPNRAEMSAATGLRCDSDEEAELAASVMIAKTGAAVIMTRSAQGISYFHKDQAPLHLPTFARSVFDVSGAGDTVVAALSLGIASNLPMAEVIRLANHAAGIVVAKLGTAVVSASELLIAIGDENNTKPPRKGAPVTLEVARRLRETWREQGLKVGFTNGCFDLLHPGHIRLLEQAAAAADRLIVALNTDASVKRLKGDTRPIQDENARATVIGALSAVDIVVLFDEDTPLNLISALLPDLLIKGSDYTIDTVVGAKEVIAAGGRVLLVDLVAGQSSTKLVAKARTS